MSPGVLGGIFTSMSLINMLLIAPASFAADRLGRKVVIVPSLLVTAVGLLLYAGADTYTLFIVASAVTAAGAAVAGPAPAAYAADIAPPGARGLAMGLYRTTGDFGFVIGPPLLGALADRTSFGWGLAANAALLALASLAFLVFARETVGRSRRPAVPAAAVARAARRAGCGAGRRGRVEWRDARHRARVARASRLHARRRHRRSRLHARDGGPAEPLSFAPAFGLPHRPSCSLPKVADDPRDTLSGTRTRLESSPAHTSGCSRVFHRRGAHSPSDSWGFHAHTPAIGARLRAERTPVPVSGAWGGALQLAAARSCPEGGP